MKKIISTTALLGLTMLLLPANLYAYKPTGQTAVKLTDTTAMYTISYNFASPSRDMYLPIRTARSADSSKILTLGYEMLIDKEVKTDIGNTAALVLSDAKIVNNTYFIPAGSVAKFTLVGFFRTDVDTPEADYALKVNKLPFTEINSEDTVIKNGLTEPELSYYLTDEIELNQ